MAEFRRARSPLYIDLILTGIAAMVISTLAIQRFTNKDELEKKVMRVRVTLEQIYVLQETYYREKGTYLDIDEGKNTGILGLRDPNGSYTYTCEATDSTFTVIASGDIDGDGQQDVWSIDQSNPSPLHIIRD